MIESRGTHFEPRLLDLFIDILPRLIELKDHWDNREAAGAVAA